MSQARDATPSAPLPPGGAGRTRFAPRAAHRLSYESSGDIDGTPVLALHDLLADRGQLRPLAAELTAAQFRVTLPDARGHGASAMVSGLDYPARELAADALAILDAEGLATAHLVAVGWAATIALEVAIRAPERTSAITLIEPYLPALLLEHPNPNAREYGEAHLKVHQEAIEASSRGQTDRLLDLYPGVRWGAGWRERTTKPRLGAIRRAAANLAPHLSALSADRGQNEALRAIETPLTMLVRSDAQPVERWNAEALSLLVPGSGVQMVTIPGGELDRSIIAPEWAPVLLRVLLSGPS
jgi:pimeloyl-ACP methyl ester carboxylesterase